MSGFETFAAAAMAAISTAQTISAQNASAKQASAQANYLRVQADNERRMAELREIALRRNQSRDQARSRALLAGRGIDVGSGSALLAREQAAMDAEFDALLERSADAAQVAGADYRARVAADATARARQSAFPNNSKTLLNFGRQGFSSGGFLFGL